MGLFSVLCNGIEYALLRRIGNKSPAGTSVIWVGVLVSVLTIVCMPTFNFPINPLSGMDWIWICAVGVASYVYQYFYSYTQQFEHPENASIMFLIPVVIVIPFDFIFFHSTILGADLIAFGFILIFTILNGILLLFDKPCIRKHIRKYSHNSQGD